MKKVKEFTIRKSRNCSDYLFTDDGSKCCALGSFYKACGVPLSQLKGHGGLNSSKIENTLRSLYGEQIEDVMLNIPPINDNKKSSWERRISKIRAEFKKIGVKVNLAE